MIADAVTTKSGKVATSESEIPKRRPDCDGELLVTRMSTELPRADSKVDIQVQDGRIPANIKIDKLSIIDVYLGRPCCRVSDPSDEQFENPHEHKQTGAVATQSHRHRATIGHV